MKFSVIEHSYYKENLSSAETALEELEKQARELREKVQIMKEAGDAISALEVDFSENLIRKSIVAGWNLRKVEHAARTGTAQGYEKEIAEHAPNMCEIYAQVSDGCRKLVLKI